MRRLKIFINTSSLDSNYYDIATHGVAPSNCGISFVSFYIIFFFNLFVAKFVRSFFKMSSFQTIYYLENIFFFTSHCFQINKKELSKRGQRWLSMNIR